MRRVICALFALALAPPAFAADLPVLRGTEEEPVGPALFTRWSGFYAGGQIGYSGSNADFSAATSPLIAFSLRELALENEQAVSSWPVLGEANAMGTTAGAFLGYNTQWQDLILGLEAGYTFAPLDMIAPSSPISRATSAGGNTYDVTVTGSASLKLIDYESLRARAGWVLGNFLPYGFAGFVLGRADYTRTALAFGQENPSVPPYVPCNHVIAPKCVDFAFPSSDSQRNALLYGFSVGGGVDVALTSNVFVRGEFEYIRFAPIADILVSVVSARVGGGVKF